MAIITSEQKQYSNATEDSADDNPTTVVLDTETRTGGHFSIGGPYSAFSGLVRQHETPNCHLADELLFKRPFHTQFLGPEVCNIRRDFPTELPIAPAFAQICEYLIHVVSKYKLDKKIYIRHLHCIIHRC